MNIDLFFALLNSTIRSTTPVLLAAVACAYCNHTGVFNIALEGQMLIGSFVAIVVNWFTKSTALAILGGTLAGGLVGLLVAILQVKFRGADMVIGTSVNLFVSAITAILLFIIFGVKGSFRDPGLISLTKIELPIVKDIPYLSTLFQNLTILDYAAYVISIGIGIYLYRTVGGFRHRSIGIKPEAAISMGLNPTRIRMQAVIVSGLLCGIGGVALSMGQVTLFTENMTSGRGFIGMAAANLGRNNPIGIIFASLFFGLADALGSFAQGVIPSQITMAIPYIATIVALILIGIEYKRRPKRAM